VHVNVNVKVNVRVKRQGKTSRENVKGKRRWKYKKVQCNQVVKDIESRKTKTRSYDGRGAVDYISVQ